MESVKFVIEEGEAVDTLQGLGARYGVSLGGVIRSAPEVGLVLHDAVLAKGFDVSTEPFRMTEQGKQPQRVVSTFQVAKMFADAANASSMRSKSPINDSHTLEVFVDEKQSEQAARKCMTLKHLTNFGLRSLLVFGQIYEETPFVDHFYIRDRKSSYKGELALQRQKDADQLQLRPRRTGLIGRAIISSKVN